jgi:YggT family protein
MIRLAVDVYCFLIFLYSLLSFAPQLRYQSWYSKLRKICEFTLKPIRKYMPKELPVDLSPVAAIFALQIAKSLLGAIY